MNRTLSLLLAACLGLLVFGCKSSKPADNAPAAQTADAGAKAQKPASNLPSDQTADAGIKAQKPASNLPADHTVDVGGKMHKPGLNKPEANCASCHGSDLAGGAGPSCTTECHGKLW